MRNSGRLTQLIQALRCLPGVGPKSAQRMSLHLLQHNREGARLLAEALLGAVEHIGLCRLCRTLTEHEICRSCSDGTRDDSLLCIVESPAEVFALEQSTGFKGRFFVLNGRLSPLDGIGPEELRLDLLEQRLAQGVVEELILATNTTVEGEATAHFIAEMAKQHGIKTSRIAYGVPYGGELEYVDGTTLAHAFNGRRQLT
ncbi:recombination protein RecR [Candidatus Methylospira mobilis]|uniref:Recombination protein RecR n=1 Tax=Candidatus Methylospira mobilis TaxID=1808979 RepID=A0A5Q0BJ60_9GAMM|nr:recombination mediator RecR [Candidatus Methylospira mobilis]QFY43599.1 recombination protein RecR [Candidatus Methylospira mobilis]WNV04588.1 recombination mediator RecR [Candidatus Methylospira mobilis]